MGERAAATRNPLENKLKKMLKKTCEKENSNWDCLLRVKETTKIETPTKEDEKRPKKFSLFLFQDNIPSEA